MCNISWILTFSKILLNVSEARSKQFSHVSCLLVFLVSLVWLVWLFRLFGLFRLIADHLTILNHLYFWPSEPSDSSLKREFFIKGLDLELNFFVWNRYLTFETIWTIWIISESWEPRALRAFRAIQAIQGFSSYKLVELASSSCCSSESSFWPSSWLFYSLLAVCLMILFIESYVSFPPCLFRVPFCIITCFEFACLCIL